MTSLVTFTSAPAILGGKRRDGEEMVKSCCAVGCLTKGSSQSFYRFPTENDRRRRWISAINRKDWRPTQYSYVCSAHFVSGKKSDDPVSPDYVPSMFKHVGSPFKRKRVSDYQKYKGKKSRVEVALREEARKEAEKRRREEVIVATVEDVAEEATGTGEDSNNDSEGLLTSETAVQTELSMEVKVVRENVLTETFLQCNRDAIKFYTGLPSYSLLKTVFDFVSPLDKHHNSALPLFQQFLMTLVKLRLNLCDQDLAYRFGVSQSTVSRNFRKWIDIMYIRLKPWPSREAVTKTMPVEFRRDFKNCICIIDCFEVFCEHPSDLMARAQTFSNYKHHNTVKFLIAITPQGVISFVSKGWGGRVSDKHLTENCVILNFLQPGDVILADRGFTVQDSVGLCCAEVKMPPFTRGKKQLSRSAIDTARQLSRVRIHVEGLLGLCDRSIPFLSQNWP